MITRPLAPFVPIVGATAFAAQPGIEPAELLETTEPIAAKSTAQRTQHPRV
jgi:hypothetical protein